MEYCCDSNSATGSEPGGTGSTYLAIVEEMLDAVRSLSMWLLGHDVIGKKVYVRIILVKLIFVKYNNFILTVLALNFVLLYVVSDVFVDLINGYYTYIVRDLLLLDERLILQYLSLLWYPIIVFLVLPFSIVIFLYASAFFLSVYKWRNQLQEAYHHAFWDGALETLAAIWDSQAYLYHG